MVKLRDASAILCALTLATSIPAAARVERVESDDTCWSLLNELAAAAVFADLSDDKLEATYGLLDRLQDACEAQKFADANEVRVEIEKLVGK